MKAQFDRLPSMSLQRTRAALPPSPLNMSRELPVSGIGSDA
jgi:hypothetical protein